MRGTPLEYIEEYEQARPSMETAGRVRAGTVFVFQKMVSPNTKLGSKTR